jgi:drug/metabolite transporter (DMT)-like permease
VLLAMMAGCLLAGHFVAFMTSVGLTSVASATALINSQIVWAAVISRLTGQHISRRAWWGVGISVAGVALITGVDFQLSAAAVTGDFIALAGGVLGGGYIVTGSHVRKKLSSPSYTLLCYGAGTLLLFPLCLITGKELLNLPLNDWLAIIALTLFAQLIGQNVFNHVLRSIPPTLVSLGMLFTAPLSAALAWIFLNQVPPISAAVGLVVLVFGAALVISGSLRSSQEKSYRASSDDNPDQPPAAS